MVVMVTNVNKERETNRGLNNRKNKEKRIVMLRTDSAFSKLTEISSITGTFWTTVSCQVKKQGWNIYIWIPLRVGSTLVWILSHRELFFKKRKIFKFLFPCQILPFLQRKLAKNCLYNDQNQGQLKLHALDVN